MESPSDHAVTMPPEDGRHRSDLSILIEDLRQFAFDDDSVPESFSNAAKEFEESSCEIQTIRTNKKIVVEKLFEQYNDSDDASEILAENAKLFEELQQVLLSETKSLTSDEDREAFVSEKLWLEEAIEKYQNDISLLETQGVTEMENIKTKYNADHARLREQKRSLEAEIHDFMKDLERQKNEMKVQHDRTLEQLLTKFQERLSELEELRNHRKCESELASRRSSWDETLQGSEFSNERTRNEVPKVRTKKRRTAFRGRVSRRQKSEGVKEDPPYTGNRDSPCSRECAVVIEAMNEVPDSSDDLTPTKPTSDEFATSKIVSDNCSSGQVTSEESSTKARLGPNTATDEGPQDVAVAAVSPRQPSFSGSQDAAVPASPSWPSPSGSREAAIEADGPSQSSLLTPAGNRVIRKRLFAEQPIEGTCGIITDSSPRTIEEYLQSLKRIVSENTKQQKRLKRKGAL